MSRLPDNFTTAPIKTTPYPLTIVYYETETLSSLWEQVSGEKAVIAVRIPLPRTLSPRLMLDMCTDDAFRVLVFAQLLQCTIINVW